MSIPLPPDTPKEYGFTFLEHYYAVADGTTPGVAPGTVVASEATVGSQYWSYAQQSMRGIVSASDQLAHLTTTDYSNQASGSLVADLLAGTCAVYPVEGGSSFASYDFYRNMIANALANNVTVDYWVDPDFTYDGTSYGSVDVWRGTPPTGVPGRLLTYTIGFATGTSLPVLYGVNGTELLPYQGSPVSVLMNVTNTRSNFIDYGDGYAWPAAFFSTACPFPAPAASPGPSAAPSAVPSAVPAASPTPCPAVPPPSKDLSFGIPLFSGIVGGSAVGGGLLSLALRALCKRVRGGKKRFTPSSSTRSASLTSTSSSKSRAGRSGRSGGASSSKRGGYLGESLLRENL